MAGLNNRQSHDNVTQSCSNISLSSVKVSCSLCYIIITDHGSNLKTVAVSKTHL